MNLFDLQCKCCGGELMAIEGESRVAKCRFCGKKQSIPILTDEKRANSFNRAEQLRRNSDYDKAIAIYEKLIEENPTDPEAYWSMVLCRFGVEYVKDPMSGVLKPTVNRTQFTSILADEDYKSAIKYAAPEQKSLYEEEAHQINEIQKGILEIARGEEPFDIFICYKESDEHGKRTKDSILAQELYHELERDGYKVFFARVTLDGKLGSAYEPYIFSALNSAKVMVVLGTKPEYFNAVWVKNEWSRFLGMIKNGEKKALIPAYKDMDAYDLPEEFSHLQALNMDKLGFMADLVMGIEKMLSFYKKDDKKKESAPSVETTAPASAAPVVKKKKSKLPLILISLLLVGAIVAGVIVVPKLLDSGKSEESSGADSSEALLESNSEENDTTESVETTGGLLESDEQTDDSDSGDDFNPFGSGDGDSEGETDTETGENSDDTTESGDDTTESGDDTTESGDDTTESGDDTTESGDDTTEIGGDTTESGDDTTEIGGDTTEIGGDTEGEDDTTEKSEDTTEKTEDTTEKTEDTSNDEEDTSENEEDTSDKEDDIPCEHPTTEKNDKCDIVCTVCGETVESGKHTVVKDEAVEPDCENTGLTEGSHCSECGTVIKAQETVQAKGHTEVIDKAVEPDCENTGLTEGKHCSVCEKVLKAQETVQAKGHTEVIDKAVEPDCENTGLTEGKHCSACGTVIKAQETVQATGHKEETIEAVEPDCENTGLTAGTRCSVCEKVLKAQETVEAKGHTPEVISAVAPTCEESGNGEGSRCSVCKKTLEEPEVIQPLGHKAGEPDPDDECNVYCANNCGTLMEANKHGANEVDTSDHCKLKCSVCKTAVGGSSHDLYVDYADNCNEKCHNCGDTVEEGKHETDRESGVVTAQPTYSEKGTMTYYCKNCHAVSETEDIPVLDDLRFEENSSGGYTVYGNGYTGENAIPTEYNGKPVTEIGDYAFSDVTGISTLVLPDSIIHIGREAFKNSDISLTAIPDGIKTIGAYAFENNKAIISLEFHEGVESIGNRAFLGCTNLTSLIIRNPDIVITDGAFNDCTNISYVEMPAHALDYVPRGNIVTAVITSGNTLSDSIFRDNQTIQSVTLPASLTSVSYCAFADCPKLTSVTFAENSQITRFERSAFGGCTALESITLPDSLEFIAIKAFEGCTKLGSIVIPASVTTFEDEVFTGCTALSSVTYEEGSRFTTMGGGIFNGCSALQTVDFARDSALENLGGSILRDIDSLTTVILPDGLLTIGEYAFYGCDNLENITLPENLQDIGANAFEGCSKLRLTTLPASITHIGGSAFRSCAGLTALTLPEGVSLDRYVFYDCENLKSITVPDSVTFTANGSDTGMVFGGSTQVTSATIPLTALEQMNKGELVTVVITSGAQIGDYEFYNCAKLQSVTIPASVKTIKHAAFLDCGALTEVIFSGESQLETIETGAFRGCGSLEKLYIPASVTSINNDQTFMDCIKLTKIFYGGTQEEWSALGATVPGAITYEATLDDYLNG